MDQSGLLPEQHRWPAPRHGAQHHALRKYRPGGRCPLVRCRRHGQVPGRRISPAPIRSRRPRSITKLGSRTPKAAPSTPKTPSPIERPLGRRRRFRRRRRPGKRHCEAVEAEISGISGSGVESRDGRPDLGRGLLLPAGRILSSLGAEEFITSPNRVWTHAAGNGSNTIRWIYTDGSGTASSNSAFPNGTSESIGF